MMKKTTPFFACALMLALSPDARAADEKEPLVLEPALSFDHGFHAGGGQGRGVETIGGLVDGPVLVDKGSNGAFRLVDMRNNYFNLLLVRPEGLVGSPNDTLELIGDAWADQVLLSPEAQWYRNGQVTGPRRGLDVGWGGPAQETYLRYSTSYGRGRELSVEVPEGVEVLTAPRSAVFRAQDVPGEGDSRPRHGFERRDDASLNATKAVTQRGALQPGADEMHDFRIIDATNQVPNEIILDHDELMRAGRSDAVILGDPGMDKVRFAQPLFWRRAGEFHATAQLPDLVRFETIGGFDRQLAYLVDKALLPADLTPPMLTDMAGKTAVRVAADEGAWRMWNPLLRDQPRYKVFDMTNGKSNILLVDGTDMLLSGETEIRILGDADKDIVIFAPDWRWDMRHGPAALPEDDKDDKDDGKARGKARTGDDADAPPPYQWQDFRTPARHDQQLRLLVQNDLETMMLPPPARVAGLARPQGAYPRLYPGSAHYGGKGNPERKLFMTKGGRVEFGRRQLNSIEVLDMTNGQANQLTLKLGDLDDVEGVVRIYGDEGIDLVRLDDAPRWYRDGAVEPDSEAKTPRMLRYVRPVGGGYPDVTVEIEATLGQPDTGDRPAPRSQDNPLLMENPRPGARR